jgi:hypothetical protein
MNVIEEHTLLLLVKVVKIIPCLPSNLTRSEQKGHFASSEGQQLLT